MSRAGRAVASWGSGLATLALRTEAFGERGAWRASRAAHGAILALHESVTRLASGMGWGEFTAFEAEAAWRGSVIEIPPYAPHDAPEKDLPAIDPASLHDGFVPVRGGPSARIEDLTFREMPGGSPSMYEQFLFYSLDGVERLRAASERSDDPVWLGAALALARRWCRVCLQTERVPFVWDDHIAAVRSLAIARLWCSLRAAGGASMTAEDRALLAEAMARHARRLALPAFYRREHNHGVTQAVALLVLGILLAPHPDSRAWVEIGAARLRDQADRNVTKRGTHREHSPFYHFYVLRQLLEGARWAARQGVPFDDRFESRLRAMLHAGAHMIQPDGRLVALGDTHRGSYAATLAVVAGEPPSPELDAFRHSASAGSLGAPPGVRRFRDDDAGVFFARSGWGEERPFDREQYLSLRLGTEPTSHVHADVLSFTWHVAGRDVIVDSGGPFGYGTPWRRDYFLRGRAHNTIVVDDVDCAVGRASLERSLEGPGWFALDTRFSPVAGAEHRRLLLAPDTGVLLVVDRVASSERHAWSNHVHLAPALEPSLDGRSVVARDGVAGAPFSLRIEPLVATTPAPILARGAEAPPQGWVCAGDLRREPCTTVTFLEEGERVVFATLFAAGELEAPPVSASLSTRTGAGAPASIRLTIGRRRFLVEAPVGGPAAVTAEDEEGDHA
ncbi:MAG TPA: heparinase II/III family protein [Candidatus Eisenbacteria bacterium]|nr:heparinase II/III family protein [Candidatus Eisenbacteria bacterium]